jgi:hypothetical protein
VPAPAERTKRAKRTHGWAIPVLRDASAEYSRQGRARVFASRYRHCPFSA